MLHPPSWRPPTAALHPARILNRPLSITSPSPSAFPQPAADYNSTLDINHAPKSQPFNDIALIILAEPSDAPTVQLPEAGGRRQPEAGDVLWAAGYGLTEEGRVSDELR